jgi:tetratricopeptide (TPR) repeat protein
VELKQGYASGHHKLAMALERQGQIDEAAHHYSAAVRLDPKMADAHSDLGFLWEAQGHWSEALVCYRQAVTLVPTKVRYRCNLAGALIALGQAEEGQTEFREASRRDPNWPITAAKAAWMLATHPDARIRNGEVALQLARHACQAEASPNPMQFEALAAANAELGNFAEAIAAERQALAQPNLEPSFIEAMNARLSLYEHHRPYRENRRSSTQQYP